MINSVRLASSDEFPDYYYRVHLEELNNRRHLRFSRQVHKHHTLLSHLTFVDEIIGRGDEYYLVLASNGILVGTWTLTFSQGAAKCNILIYSSFSGQGFGSAVWMHAIERTKCLGMAKFEAGTHLGNFPMRAIFEKSGMTIETFRESTSLLHVFFSLNLTN